MKCLLSLGLTCMITVALLCPASSKTHPENALAVHPSNEFLQQGTEQEPADSFDENSIHPEAHYFGVRRASRRALGARPGVGARMVRRSAVPPFLSNPPLNQALLDLVQTPETLAIREMPIESNSGPEVNEYLLYCNVAPPAWWCAAFVSFEIKQASMKPHIRRSRWPNFAACDDIYRWASRHHLIIQQPEVPSVMLIPNTDPSIAKRYVHTGFVVGYHPETNKLDTVEGNSNNDGSHNGIGVFKLKRTKKQGMVFVKIV